MSKQSVKCCHLSQEINNCGGWKSVEKKNEENQENKNISKDSSPDDGIVIKVLIENIICKKREILLYFYRSRNKTINWRQEMMKRRKALCLGKYNDNILEHWSVFVMHYNLYTKILK